VPIVLKSGRLNLLEHSGPVQACNGIALPLCSYGEILLKWILNNEGTMSMKILIWFITGMFGYFSLGMVTELGISLKYTESS
jgi:hypothetical protein